MKSKRETEGTNRAAGRDLIVEKNKHAYNRAQSTDNEYMMRRLGTSQIIACLSVFALAGVGASLAQADMPMQRTFYTWVVSLTQASNRGQAETRRPISSYTGSSSLTRAVNRGQAETRRPI